MRQIFNRISAAVARSAVAFGTAYQRKKEDWLVIADRPHGRSTPASRQAYMDHIYGPGRTHPYDLLLAKVAARGH